MSGSQPVVLGRIGAPHGIGGWVRVHSSARPPESIVDFRHWLIARDGRWRETQLVDFRLPAKGIVVRLDGCTDRDDAAALRDAQIAVPRDALPEPADGEWYWADLLGLRVETVDGVLLGTVDHLIETGANDVLVVHGERERLVPWIPGTVIHRVDVAGGTMVVDWDPEF